MPSADYMRRMETLLAAKLDVIEAEQSTRKRRPLQIAGAMGGATVFFFVLKAAAFSHNGNAFTTTLAAEAGFGAQVYHWFAGADPITTSLAAAMRLNPAPARASL